MKLHIFRMLNIIKLKLMVKSLINYWSKNRSDNTFTYQCSSKYEIVK